MADSWMSENCVPGLVSIVVPTYNRASLLPEALASVLAQTYRPIECIVVDDGSTDGTEECMRPWCARSKAGLEFRYLRQNRRGGCAARNRGLCESRGEFIGFLDSDDQLLPESVREKVTCLAGSSADYCYDRGHRVDEHGKTVGYFGVEWPAAGSALFVTYLFDTMGPLIRRSACIAVGPWNESLPGWQEIEYFARLKLHLGRGEFLDRVGHIVVEHTGSRVVGSREHGDSVPRAQELILETVRQAGPGYAHEARFLEGMLRLTYAGRAFRLYESGDADGAMRFLKKAYQFGYRKWHVRSVLRVYERLSWPVVGRIYFWMRKLGHLAKLVCARPLGCQQPDEIRGLFETLKNGA